MKIVNDLMGNYEKALHFMDYHPAICIPNRTFRENMWYWCEAVCKNGQYKDFHENPKNIKVSVHQDDPKFIDFIKYMDKDDIDDYKDGDDTITIDVPYKVYYGYEWKFDKYLHMGEYCIYKFTEDMLYKVICIKDGYIWGDDVLPIGHILYGKNRYDSYPDEYFLKVKSDINNTLEMIIDSQYAYNAYQGSSIIYADTYEELIVKMYNDVQKKYGKYCFDDFLTPEEKETRKNNEPFFMEELTNGNFKMVTNKKYIRIPEQILNLRWWDWYKTTEHYKNTWGK